MLVKFWDLDTRHCFKTIVSHRSEVNDLLLLNNEERLLTGCHDNELRVFEIIIKADEETGDGADIQPNMKKLKINSSGTEENSMDEDDDEGTNETSSILDCRLLGSLIRESKDQLSQLAVDKTCTVFSSHSANEKHVELFKINTPEEIKKRLAKKLKKQKRKLISNETSNATGSDNNEENEGRLVVYLIYLVQKSYSFNLSKFSTFFPTVLVN